MKFIGDREVLDPGELNQARLLEARRIRLWVEIPDDLVERPLHQWVSASSDQVYTLYTGPVWKTGTVDVFADRIALHFFVRANNQCVFVTPTGRKWGDVTARRARGRVPA